MGESRDTQQAGCPPGSRSVERSLDALALLARRRAPIGLSEIARELAIPKSSALQLLRALVARRFAAIDEDGRYCVGVRSFEVGSAFLSSSTPLGTVEPLLESITGSLSVTSHFAVLDGDGVVYLAKRDPAGPGVVLASSLGGRLDASTTAVGMAQLAWSSGSEWPAERRSALAMVRARGYALDEGATAPGIRCVAAAVQDARGVVGAIGTSSLQHGNPPLGELVRAVTCAAASASQSLGGPAPSELMATSSLR